MRKLACVLLVDDDAATNFLHRRVLNKLDCAERIVEVKNGTAALEFLTSAAATGAYPKPELILLDINMPGMNGWEFIETYQKLPAHQLGGIVIVMLTTSLNPDDEVKAREIEVIDEFSNKPLTVDKLSEVLEKHFAEPNGSS